MKTIVPQIRRAAAEIGPMGPIGPIRPIAATGARAIEVEIEQVVFHGFSRSQSQRASAALQRELTRLVSAHGVPKFSGGAPESLDAGTIRAVAARPEVTGIRAARAIHGGLRA